MLRSLAIAARGLDQLLHTAHQQRIRQLRKIQQMRRHSEATAALHRSWQLKQKQEEEQQRHIQEERQQAARAKLQHEQLIEVNFHASHRLHYHSGWISIVLLCCSNTTASEALHREMSHLPKQQFCYPIPGANCCLPFSSVVCVMLVVASAEPCVLVS